MRQTEHMRRAKLAAIAAQEHGACHYQTASATIYLAMAAMRDCGPQFDDVARTLQRHVAFEASYARACLWRAIARGRDHD